MRRTFGSILTFGIVACWPAPGAAQMPAPPPSSTIDVSPRWEVSLEGRVGFPTGYIRVDENEIHGSRFRFNDLGVSVSEAVEGSAAFWLTPRDTVRASFLYYFLGGGSSLDRAVVYDGGEVNTGHVDANFDFWRASLAYERVLTSVLDRGRLIGSAGLTYVWLNAGLTQGGKSKAEDFYRQELPVPILGLRLEAPITDRLGIRAAVSGGLLPKVDSLRKEGGTVYTWQSHADASLAVTYALTKMLQAEAGYQFVYLHQHEKSHEDNNIFELIDNGLRGRLTLRFW
jgi:hypothetical protein